MDRAEEGMGDGRGDGRDWMKNEDSERQYARQGESHKLHRDPQLLLAHIA